MTRLAIVGGSDAGTEAALRARRIDASLEITMIVADGYLNYSICGLPFFVSGEVEDRRALAHRTEAQVRDQGIEVLLDHRARAIDPRRRLIDIDGRGPAQRLYDTVVIATGARPVRPSIPGLDGPDVHVLHTMDDGIRLRERLDARPPERVAVVGSGYIGVEMADALSRRGIEVTLVGRAPTVLPTIDPSLGSLLATELQRHGVTVHTGVAVEGIGRVRGHLQVRTIGAPTVSTDLVVIAAGVRPDTELARAAGVTIGPSGAIRVNRRMETDVPGVYAAGDCVETWHALLERPMYLPLGTTAHKQGRVAGENAAGADRSFAGSLGTQVVKVFDLAAARTGLDVAQAAAAGFSPVAVETVVPDHKTYYPGAHDLHIRIVGDTVTGRLLGAQIVGHWQAAVAKRIDVFAAAIHGTSLVRDLLDLDLSYTPPVAAPWDPVQAAADTWVNR